MFQIAGVRISQTWISFPKHSEPRAILGVFFCCTHIFLTSGLHGGHQVRNSMFVQMYTIIVRCILFGKLVSLGEIYVR